jgi:hypothetical protein
MIRNVKKYPHPMEKPGLDRRQFFCWTAGAAGAIAVAHSIYFL